MSRTSNAAKMEDQGFTITKINRIARQAGAAILEVYHSDLAPGIRQKEDNTPVTRADLAADQIIRQALALDGNGFPVLSEEGLIPPYDERKHWKRYWLVDPLDGTKEFIKRNGEFTVNIALIEDRAPVFGCIFVPVTGELFWAQKGHGAFRVSGDESRRMQVGGRKPEGSGLRVVASRSYLDPRTEAYIGQLEAPEIVPVGSSIKFMLLARGRADLYPRYGPTMEWDTAAAQIILEEAGGRVLQMGLERPLVYNKPSLVNPDFLAMGS